MRLSRVGVVFFIAGMGISAQNFAGEPWQMESRSDADQARERLRKAADAAPSKRRRPARLRRVSGPPSGSRRPAPPTSNSNPH